MSARSALIAAAAFALVSVAGTARADSIAHSGRASAHSAAAGVHASAAAATGAAGIVAIPLLSAGAAGRLSGAAGEALMDTATRPLEITRDRPTPRPAGAAGGVREPSPGTMAR